MSSSSFPIGADSFYMWNDRLDFSDYIGVTFYIETPFDPERAGLGLAIEQSVLTTKVDKTDVSNQLAAFAAKLSRVEKVGETTDTSVPLYQIDNVAYQISGKQSPFLNQAFVTLEFPISIFGASLIALWNTIGGEVHRVGFLSSCRLTEIRFPDSFIEPFSGPIHGTNGIRERLGVFDRPLFCRAARPATGLTTVQMLSINREVLEGGFDLVKDDELTFDYSQSRFEGRVKAMMKLVKDVEQKTGERKGYIANLVGDTESLMERAELAERAGVSGVLVAPGLQGFDIARVLARRFSFFILYHNSWFDVITRNPKFGVSPSVILKMQRLMGVDMALTPGDFATSQADAGEELRCMEACLGKFGKLLPIFPVIAGGKRASHLFDYAAKVGGADFMVIAATHVDNHPKGARQGASEFRDAWSRGVKKVA